MANFTKKQVMILIVFGLGQFCSALCVALQSPFYPAEAASKGVAASEYGFVFGVYGLTMFFLNPIYGMYLSKLGVKHVNNLGIFTVSVSCILFGFLHRVYNSTAFVGLSYAIRIVEAFGASAFKTASYSIFVNKFSENVGSAFSVLLATFDLGLIIGPTMGGGLYEVGGFQFPFSVVGFFLLVATVSMVLLLRHDTEESPSTNPIGMMKMALTIPAIVLSCLVILSTSVSITFLEATLEPHLRPLKLSFLSIGLMFGLSGIFSSCSEPVWGYLCDKGKKPRVVSCIGSFLIAVSFFLVGPFPPMNVPLSVPICAVAMTAQGLGVGACLIAAFSCLHRDALSYGFPDDISTYGIISALWSSSFSLGYFIGPSLAGVLFDLIGFAWAAQIVVVIHLILAFITSCNLMKVSPVRSYQEAEERFSLPTGSGNKGDNLSSVNYPNSYGATEPEIPPTLCNEQVSDKAKLITTEKNEAAH